MPLLTNSISPFTTRSLGVDAGAGKHFAPVARPCPAGDLFRPVAILLVVRDGIIQRGQHHGSEQFAGTLPLFEVESGAVNEIGHEFVLFLLFSLVAFGEYA